jgi:hypothetical protein
MSIIEQEKEVEAALAKARGIYGREGVSSPTLRMTITNTWDEVNGTYFKRTSVDAISPPRYDYQQRRFVFSIILAGGTNIVVRSPEEVPNSGSPDKELQDLHSFYVGRYAS